MAELRTSTPRLRSYSVTCRHRAGHTAAEIGAAMDAIYLASGWSSRPVIVREPCGCFHVFRDSAAAIGSAEARGWNAAAIANVIAARAAQRPRLH